MASKPEIILKLAKLGSQIRFQCSCQVAGCSSKLAGKMNVESIRSHSGDLIRTVPKLGALLIDWSFSTKGAEGCSGI